MQTDIKFKLWIEIKKLNHLSLGAKNWTIGWCIHNCTIYDEQFFIENYPVKQWVDDGKTYTSQSFSINKKLMDTLGKLILPLASPRNHFSVEKRVAWDYWSYLTHSKFTFNVHPVSMSNDFFRMEYEGTQGQIYSKCLRLYNEWISKSKNLT